MRRWYNNLKHGSIISAEVGLRRIGRACKLFDTTPAKMAKMSVKEATDLCMDLVTELDSQGKQPKYIDNFVKVMKSWFGHNGIKITEKIKIPDGADNPSKKDMEQSPTPDQFRRVLDACDLKQKVEATSVGYAGSRIESIGDYVGRDGLKIKDFPEMTIDNDAKEVEFAKVPTMVVIRRNLSKAGHQYFTFMPDEGCEYLKEQLELRMSKGEVLTPESPIVTSLKWHSKSMKDEKVGHISSRKVGSSIKKAIEKAGFDWRPYILRTYFDTRLMMAEADRLIIRDWRVFFMGHRGDIEHVYTLNKTKLPEDLVEKMREAYRKAAEKHLVAGRKSGLDRDMVKATFNAQFLEMGGFSKEEIDTIRNLSELSTAELKKMIQDKQKERMGLNGNSQKIVAMDQLEEHIVDGWEYVRELLNGKAIIRLPK